jgi:hypothetical protein
VFNFIYPLGKDRKWERERLKRLKKEKGKGETEIKERLRKRKGRGNRRRD